MLVQIEQPEDDGDDLDDLSYTPRSWQQPDQIKDQEKDRYDDEQADYAGRHGTSPSRVA